MKLLIENKFPFIKFGCPDCSQHLSTIAEYRFKEDANMWRRKFVEIQNHNKAVCEDHSRLVAENNELRKQLEARKK
jgi:hypothetical protein